jgi:hypothetical protein
MQRSCFECWVRACVSWAPQIAISAAFPAALSEVLVSGTATGAVLGQMLVGRVQTEAVVIVAILGVIISFIVGMFSRRRVSD